ncbi:MAG: hypothetical protein IKQ54_08895 [Oscillospiraceae bacterium]|nr:hypothetical protein [Oscillospiraceae bacterium]
MAARTPLAAIRTRYQADAARRFPAHGAPKRTAAAAEGAISIRQENSAHLIPPFFSLVYHASASIARENRNFLLSFKVLFYFPSTSVFIFLRLLFFS